MTQDYLTLTNIGVPEILSQLLHIKVSSTKSLMRKPFHCNTQKLEVCSFIRNKQDLLRFIYVLSKVKLSDMFFCSLVEEKDFFSDFNYTRY